MQQPIYKFYPGQIVYAERDYEKKCLAKLHVVNVFEDTYSTGEVVKCIVIRRYSTSKQCWYYHTYREFELSYLMYLWGRECYAEESATVKAAIRKYEIVRVADFDKDGNIIEIPKKDWKIKKFK